MKFVDRIASALVAYRRIAILLLVLSFLVVGAGATQLQQDDSLQSFEIGTREEQKLDYVEANFSTGPENQTVAQIVVRDDDVLDKETLLARRR